MSTAFLTYDLLENKTGLGKGFVPGGCGFYRCLLPMRAIGANAMGHPAWDPNKGFGVRLTDTDAIFGFSTVMLKLLFDAWIPSQIEQAQAMGQRVVIDVDDHYDDIPEENPARKGTESFRSWNREHYAQSILMADTITVTTPFLRDYYAKQHPDVRMIRNSIQPGMFEQKKPTGRKPVIGWTGAIPWKTTDLAPLREWLPGFLDDNDLMFHHSGDIQGNRSFADVTGIDPARLTVLPMVQINQYNRLFAPIDIGLVPLELNDFNSAKCLDAATLVSTPRGVVPVGEVIPGDSVWNAGAWVGVIATDHEPETEGLLITTDHGRQLRLTDTHRIMVNGKWTLAGDIKVGDEVATCPDSPATGGYQRKPWPADGRRTRAEASVDFTASVDAPHVTITPRWGRFLGVFAGDGSCAGSTAVTISCDGQDSDFIDLVMDDMQAMGLAAGTEKVTTYSGELLRRRSVRCASAHLSRFLVSLGVAEWREGGKKAKRVVCVPDVIWRSPRDVVAAFLAGVFETDGTVGRSGISMTTIHHQFALDVQRLLTCLGIESRIGHKRTTYTHNGIKVEGRGAWQVLLRRAGADVFSKEVGFLSKRKRAKLADLAARPHSNAYRPQRWLEKVVSVEEVTVKPVDIQVVGEVFAAAGFVSHNSAIKGLEYAANGIPFVASPTPEYLFLANDGVGRVASTPQEWMAELTGLLDYGTRRKEAAVNAASVRERWSMGSRTDEWKAALL